MIYGWTGPALDFQYFSENLITSLKNKIKLGLNKNQTEINKKQDSIMKLFSTNDRKLILLLRKLLESKAKRVDAHSLTYFLGDKIRGEIAKRKQLSINQMRVISTEDTLKIFNRPLDIHQLNNDYSFSLFWFEQGKGIKKLAGKQAITKNNYITKRVPRINNLDKINEIKGEMAFSGKVKGGVSVVLSMENFNKFKKGQILVTRVTDPSYVPIMKIAKAIITDIGGITCHAAIVSRELKKPCIIGTKIATQVLKDGDLVEVDANQGIVKILK